MKEKSYIGRTKEYYMDDDNWVFTPSMWKWVSDPTKLAGEVHVLTKEGEELLEKWCDDVAVGYDLCNGSAKGLAVKYSSEQMWELITDTKNGYSAKVIVQVKYGRTDIFERVEEIPYGYCVWNIGRSNFPHEGCVPLAKPKPTEYDWQMCIDPDSLKYIEVGGETLALQILKEASRKGVDRNRFLEIVNQ